MTYEEFEKKAIEAGLYDTFGDADLALARKDPDAGAEILSYKQDYQAAPAGAEGDAARALARAGAESVRKTRGGYETATDGMRLTGFSDNTPTGAGALSAGITPKTTVQTESMNDLLANYRKTIGDAQKKAQEDVLGKYAAMNGGYGSSAAVTKAAEAGTDYARLLAEKELELATDARDRAETAEKEAYDRKLNEAQIAASLGDYSLLRALGIDTSAYEAKAAEEARRTAKENEQSDYAVLLRNAETAAKYGDLAKLRALGIDTSRYEQQLQAEAENATAESTSAENPLSYTQAIAAAEKGQASDAIIAAIDGVQGAGFYNRYYGPYKELYALYPNGKVTNAEDWNDFVDLYGKDALESAGFSYAGAEEETIDIATLEKEYGSVISTARNLQNAAKAGKRGKNEAWHYLVQQAKDGNIRTETAVYIAEYLGIANPEV